MQSKNLACEWNDVALLTDQRACTFLCKTMLLLPESINGQMEKIHLKRWNRITAPECEDFLTGDIQLELVYRNDYGDEKVYSAKLRLQGTITEPVPCTGEACLLYSRGQAAGQHLLLEMVVQLPCDLHLQPTQVIAGQFEMTEMLELPETWPDCADVLVTATVAEVQSCSIHQQMLQVDGRYRLTIVYANDLKQGESLFAWQQYRPFIWKKPVPGGLQELTGVKPYYQSLSVELLDSHQIRLNGNGVICTLPSEEEIPEVRNLEEVDCTDERAATKMEILSQSPSVVTSRGSCRANLSRYMRDLNGMAQSPTTIRNYEIGENRLEADTGDTKLE